MKNQASSLREVFTICDRRQHSIKIMVRVRSTGSNCVTRLLPEKSASEKLKKHINNPS
jgi:hypothetical protein